MTSPLDPSLRASLLEAVRKRALKTGVQVKLASGQTSNYYVNCKFLTLHGPSLQIVGKAIAAWLKGQAQRPEQIGGVSVGGDPMVAAAIWAAADLGWEPDGLLVRKEAKSHGMSQGKAVEGAEPRGGVWLLEDVISTGGSLRTAVDNLKREGYRLDGILAIVDRQMGGVERLRADLGVPVEAFFRIDEITG
jgi:orotate phosphoribosyltransferase